MGVARFSVSTPSRHPSGLGAYDSDHARYRPGYVVPAGWRLDLDFFPPGFREDHRGRRLMPPQIRSYEWLVEAVAGEFSITSTKDRSQFISRDHVALPASGEYTVTLSVHLIDGRTDVLSRTIELRDFLVVGIGDSFASGQGNPDLPAVPAPDQVLACKSTSVTLAARRAAEFIDSAIDSARNGAPELAEKALRSVPFVGAIAAEGLSLADDLDRWRADTLGRIEDYAEDAARDIESALAEGAEELGGWIGLGGGGEAGEVDPRPAVWQEARAYRSYRSAHSLAAQLIERTGPSGADRVTFLSFARTGSEIRDGLLGPRTVEDAIGNKLSIDGWAGDRGQVAEAAGAISTRRIDALIITVGVNDIGFSGLVQRAILKASGEKRRERVRGAKHRIAVDFSQDLDRLRTAVDRELRPRHVFITEYPVGIFAEIADGLPPCGILASEIVRTPATGLQEGLNLDRADASDYGEVGRLLNEKIRVKAEEFGWILITGIESGFDGHGYCAEHPFFVSAEESCLNQGDFEGMLHPNAAGHAVARNRIASAVRRELVAADWLEPVLHASMS